MSIQFTEICFVTENVLRLRAFYEVIFGGKPEGDEIHSSLVAGGVTFTFRGRRVNLVDLPAYPF